MWSRGISVLLLQALVCLAAGADKDEKENPIKKVVRLMTDMQKEIEIELNKEKALFEKFMCICTTADDELAETITKSGEAIKSLTSKLEAEGAEKAQLEEELKGHYKDKEASEKDLAKATMLREKEKEEFDQTKADTEFSIAALAKAIPAIEKGASGAAALMQAEDGGRLKRLIEFSPVVSTFDREQVLSFLNAGTGSASGDEAPASGQVLGILKQMKDDMEKSHEEAIESEKAASTGFTDLKSAKGEEIQIAAESIETKEKRVGELTVSISQNKDALEDSSNENADATRFLATLKKQCTEKKGAWEARLKLRNDEITAIGEAIKILTEDEAVDVFKKTTGLMEIGKAGLKKYGFLQRNHKASKLKRVQSIISTASEFYKNPQLDLLLYTINAKLKTGEKSPDFSNVVKMIENMLTVLSKEQAEDEKKKQWCTTELVKADGEERMKQEEMDSLSSTIEELADEIATLDDEVKTLQQEVTDLDKAVFMATEQRKKEHEEYSETASMTQAAIGLVEKAKNRLAKFYNPSKYKPSKEEGAFFVQIHEVVHHSKSRVAPPDLPDMPEYKPTHSGGIMGMMDMVIHDLQSDMAEAARDEKTAQKEYVELMSESQTSRAQDIKSITDKKESRAVLEEKITESKEARKMAFDELNNIHEYIAELHNTCDFIVENFDLRKEARMNEMESLKNAKAVMEGADF
jgi:hypothetical protein